MSDVEIYESLVNVQTNLSKQSENQKQAGEVIFKVPNNKTGKRRICFSPVFARKPMLVITPSLTSGSGKEDFISDSDVTGFTYHCVNTDPINELVCVLNWWAQPF